MSKTNNTTNAIIDYVTLQGGFAKRVNTSGIPIIHNGKVSGWRPSRNKGAADIRIIFNGFSIDVEVKTGKDVQRPQQWAFQQEVERAGGQYWEVKDFPDFIQLFFDWKVSKNLNVIIIQHGRKTRL